MDVEKENFTDAQRPHKQNHPLQLWTDNVFTYDVTAQIKENQLLACLKQIVSGRTKSIPQEIKETNDLLCIDQHILKEVKTMRKNIAMGWINYKKAYDLVSQTWMTKSKNIGQTYKIYHECKMAEKAKKEFFILLLYILAMMLINQFLGKCLGTINLQIHKKLLIPKCTSMA